MMIFTSIYGVADGIFISGAFAELLSCVLTIVFLITKRKKYQY